MARPRRAVFQRPKPRTSLWLSAGAAETTIVAGTATLFASLNALALALRPFTIVRTRLLMSILTDQTAADEFVQGALGAQVVTETASAAGVASVPTPLSEADADFFVYAPFMNQYNTGTSEFERTGPGSFWTIDSKSMRKVGTDDDIVFTIENRANGFNVALEGRILIKLH